MLGGAVQAELAHVFPSLPALAGGQRVSPQQERYRSHRAVRALLEHLAQPRLFRGARGGMLSESVYGRTWHPARQIALGPDLAATPLARRPYDLRHAGLSLWLNATGAPAEIAARAGNSARVLHEVYLHCTDRQEDTVSQRIKDALDASTATRKSRRLHEPSALPQTLSTICT